MIQVKLHQDNIRFLSDLEEAYDRDPDGLADMFGYSGDRMQERITDLKHAIENPI